MTSVPTAEPARPGQDDPRVVGRASHMDLGGARRNGRHLGTVECGHRFLATDADGEPIGAFRTLDAARAAVTEQCARARARRRRERSWGPIPVVVTVAVAAGAMLGAYWMLLF